MGIPIVGTEASSASVAGMSYWSSFHACPKQRYLDNLYGIGTDETEQEALGTGAVFHKLMELYYTNQLDQAELNLDNANVVEGYRLFKGYKDLFPPDEFGEVIGCEFPFLIPEDYPTNVVGVRPFTGRIDMVVRLDDTHVQRLRETRNLPLMEPGIYLLDHKTMKQKRQTVDIEMRERFQFHAYMLAWDEFFGKKYGLCKGFIANCVVKHKNLVPGSFFCVFSPFPDSDQMTALAVYLQQAYELRSRWGDQRANGDQCFKYRVCNHFISGACKRY